MKNKRYVFISILFVLIIFGGCKKEATTDDYNGILYKLRMEMPFENVLSMNSTELYQDSDNCIWTISNDTHLSKLKYMIPENDMYHYADDSLITYYFKTKEDEEDKKVLTAFSEEILCKVDRSTGQQLYTELINIFKNKYQPLETNVHSYLTGTEGIDVELIYRTNMMFNTYEINITMTQRYDTVNNIDDYYPEYFLVEVKELSHKSPVKFRTKIEDK